MPSSLWLTARTRRGWRPRGQSCIRCSLCVAAPAEAARAPVHCCALAAARPTPVASSPSLLFSPHPPLVTQEADLEKSVLLVFANKQDMAGALNAAQIGEALGLAAIKDRQWSIQETSAAAGKGLHEGFDWLATAIQAGPKN